MLQHDPLHRHTDLTTPGVGPPLASVTVVRTISFSVYQKSKYQFDQWFQNMTGDSPLARANAVNQYPTLSTILCFGCSGATAGALVTIIACKDGPRREWKCMHMLTTCAGPFELTKLNAQLAGKMARDANPSEKPVSQVNIKSGAWRTARNLFADRGFRGLYSGYRLHLSM